MSSLVSIIIRGKNEEDWLGLCLKSISMQSYKNFEVIYVDNDSSDASIKIAKEYKVNKIKKMLIDLLLNEINEKNLNDYLETDKRDVVYYFAKSVKLQCLLASKIPHKI